METNSDSLDFPRWFSRSDATHNVARGIMQYGPIARTPLAQIFNLSQGALSRITSDLIYDGVIEEMPAGSTQAGARRPRCAFARTRMPSSASTFTTAPSRCPR